MSRSPWPFRMEYETWLETGRYELDGRLARWFVYPTCVLFSKLMSVWPHEHALWIEMDNRTVVCAYLCGYHRQKMRSTDDQDRSQQGVLS